MRNSFRSVCRSWSSPAKDYGDRVPSRDWLRRPFLARGVRAGCSPRASFERSTGPNLVGMGGAAAAVFSRRRRFSGSGAFVGAEKQGRSVLRHRGCGARFTSTGHGPGPNDKTLPARCASDTRQRPTTTRHGGSPPVRLPPAPPIVRLRAPWSRPDILSCVSLCAPCCWAPATGADACNPARPTARGERGIGRGARCGGVARVVSRRRIRTEPPLTVQAP